LLFTVTVAVGKDVDQKQAYKAMKILVDLGCNPNVLGTVTWNPTTHSVDVSGSVYLNNRGLTRLPFQFGKVGVSFWCSYNRLTSLKGAPKEVGWGFWCSGNQLTSLDGAPEKVGRYFVCSYNQLTNLDGAPKEVGGGFECSADDLVDVSALRRCKIKDGIRLCGETKHQKRVARMLQDLGYTSTPWTASDPE